LLAVLYAGAVLTTLFPALCGTLATTNGIAADLFAYVERLRLPANALLETGIAILFRLPCTGPTLLALLHNITDEQVLAQGADDLEPYACPDQALLTSVRGGLHGTGGAVLGDLHAGRCAITGIGGLVAGLLTHRIEHEVHTDARESAQLLLLVGVLERAFRTVSDLQACFRAPGSILCLGTGLLAQGAQDQVLHHAGQSALLPRVRAILEHARGTLRAFARALVSVLHP